MTDYIKREDARGKLCSMCRWEGTVNCGECEHPIDDIPAADVAPVVHGRWREMDKGNYVCSFCNAFITINYGYKYCPNCGADMREERDD